MSDPSIPAPELRDLIAQFALELQQSTGTFSVKPLTPRELEEIVERWFSANHMRIREALQRSPRLHQLAYGKRERDGQAIVALVLDAISGSIAGVPLSTAALIIAHYYLDHYLGIDAQQPEKKSDAEDTGT